MLDAWAQLVQFNNGAFSGSAFGMGANQSQDGSVYLGGVERIIRSIPHKPQGAS